MPKTAEIIIFDTEEEYFHEFTERYVEGLFSIYGIPVSFVVQDFQHVFFEKSKGSEVKNSFSKRRAKKMRFIQTMLDGEMDTEVMLQEENGNLVVFCEDLDCVMYLRIRKGSGRLQLATFFDFGKDHTKMLNKQKQKCVPVTETQIQDLL